MSSQAKTFSAFTKSDQREIVPKGYAGKININPELLPRDFPPEFAPVLKILRRTISRELDAGSRPIIAYFLAFAVDPARALFHNDRLTVHSEISIPNVQIPDVGLVGGTLDL